MVNWILFPLVGFLLATAYLKQSVMIVFLLNALSNVILVTLIILILWTFTKFLTRKPFLNHSMGLGDVLFMYALALGFPTLTFIILLSCSIIFSLLLHVYIQKAKTNTTIPLAGFMSLFLIAILLWSVFSKQNHLYLI